MVTPHVGKLDLRWPAVAVLAVWGTVRGLEEAARIWIERACRA